MKASKLCIFLITLVFISIILICADLLFFRSSAKTQRKSPKQRINLSVLKQADSIINEPAIKIINIYGPIYFTEESNLFGLKSGADNIIEELNNSIKQTNITGLLLRINSPGGTVAASQEIYNAILKFRKATGKPVVVSVADLAASGAYYISAAADTVFANPSSIVGNIGVIMTGINVRKLMEKIGVAANVYTSEKHKDIGSPYREPTEEEKKMFQTTINDLYEQFKDAVKTGRAEKINADDKTIFDGRTFTGNEAVKNGLIDLTGGYYDALDYLWKLSGQKGEPKIFESQPVNIWTKILKMSSSAYTLKLSDSINLLNYKNYESQQPVKFLYQLSGDMF